MAIFFGIIHWIIQIILWIVQAFVVLVFVQAILSFIRDPYNPVRRTIGPTIDSIVNPLLNPIRRLMPPTGVLDFSPMVLIILLYIVEWILRGLLLSLG
jgi:YggT family protein